jgi:hypothetical protein
MLCISSCQQYLICSSWGLKPLHLHQGLNKVQVTQDTITESAISGETSGHISYIIDPGSIFMKCLNAKISGLSDVGLKEFYCINKNRNISPGKRSVKAQSLCNLCYYVMLKYVHNNKDIHSGISGFLHSVNDVFVLLGCYTVWTGSYWPVGTTSWPLRTGPIVCSETSATYYQPILYNMPEEWRSHIHSVRATLVCVVGLRPIFINKFFFKSVFENISIY